MNKLINQKTLNKVLEITAYFWLIKLLSTTVGETATPNYNNCILKRHFREI